MSLPPTMSGANQPKPDHYPHPPPGGPPAAHGQPAAHGSQIPTYNPAAPSFAAPPSRADTDIYNAEDDEPAPPKPPRPGQQPASTGPAGAPSAAAPATGMSKHSLSSLSSFGHKLTGGINSLAHKFGSEGFLPDSMDVECEKAARILLAFCKDGVEPETAAEAPPQTLEVPPSGRPSSSGKTSPGPKTDKQRKNRTLISIPSKVISRAVGLAIFTNARAGYLAVASLGSGVVLSRLPNGDWSAPSAINVRVGSIGAAGGADIFDCVLVFNSRETLDIFARNGTITLGGGGVSVSAGPWGAGGNLDFAASDSGPKAKGKGKEDDIAAAPHSGTGAPPVAEGSKLGKPPASPTTDGRSRSRSPLPKSKNTVISYIRSRGLYAGVQVEGTVLSERKGENARFYHADGITAAQVLQKSVAEPTVGAAPQPWQRHVQQLLDAVRSAEGYRSGSGPSTPLDPPTTLMGGMHLNDNSATTPPPAAPVGSAKVGAPQSTWTAPPSTKPGVSAGTGAAGGSFPPPPPGPPPQAAPPTAQANNAAFNASSASGASFPPPPPGGPPNIGPAMAQWKAEEAAKESAAASHGNAPPPPSYSEFDSGYSAPPPPHASSAGPSSDLPPSYVDDGQVRPGVGDSKTGQH